MWVLLLWSQTWHIPTAYKQSAQALQVFSGYAQQAWVGYLSTRAGKPHLYVHLIDTSGYEPFGKDGLCLSCGEGDGVTTWQASVSEKNHLYVAWSTADKTFIYHLNEEGLPLWRAQIPIAAQEIAISAHPEGGAVTLLRTPKELKLLFWDIHGNVRSEHVLSSERPCRHARLAGTSLDGFLVVWEVYTGSRWEVFFQKWLWQGKADASPSPLSGLPHSTEGIEILNDGFGGILCAYESLSLSGAGKDLYLVRYNRNGTRLYEVPLCQEPGDQQAPRLYKRGTEILVVWEDNRHQDWDLYYQRVDISSGKPLLTPNGVPLVRLPGPQREAHLILDYFQNEIIALWLDFRRLQGDIYFQRYSADGKPLWDFAGRPLVTRPTQQHSLRTAAQDFQFFWVAYLEDEGEKGTQPYIALLTTAGEVRLHRRLAGNIERPYAQILTPQASPWGENLLLLWRDDRDSASRPQLYMQLLSAEGKALWFAQGIPVGPQTALNQKNPQVHLQGDTAWVLWEGEESDVESDLFVQAVTREGKKLFSKPLPICIAERVQTEARWLSFSGQLYAYWTDNRSMEETGFDLYLRGVAPLSPEIGWRATRTFQNSAFLADSKVPGRIHHLWQEEVNGKYQIAYSLAPLAHPTAPVLLSPTAKAQRFLSAVADESGNLYVAFCEEAPGPYEQALRLLCISNSGEIRWQHTSPSGYKHHLYPRLYTLSSDEILGLSMGSTGGRWDLLYTVVTKDGIISQKGTLLSPIPERSAYHLVSTKGKFWLLLQMPTGYVLYEGTHLSSMKPVKLPDASCAEATLFLWKGKPTLFWTDAERRRLSLTSLSHTP
ncbi:MAG: hypothetical protein NZ989_06345 [Bacteroidia bacterium]|nr:hypothetical protein [Bacteroidia bacterium]MDW8057156.1 hypothetical protein [Bacteroidia bacterium]